MAVVAAVGALACSLPAAVSGAQNCAGDCDGDGELVVSELVSAVSIALGTTSPSACTAADVDRSGAVGIDDLLQAVVASLGSCSPPQTRTATGICMQPGKTGLVVCEAGMMVGVYRCMDPGRCLTEPSSSGVLVPLDFGRIGAQGNFSLTFSAADAGNAPLVFEAQIDANTKYRTIDYGRIAAGGGSGIDFTMVLLVPSSEAAVLLLAENGFENFAPDAVRDVIDAVATANADVSFAGSSPAEAVIDATDDARDDPAVVDAIEQGLHPTEFLVNTYTLGSESDPRVASDGSGRFVVVWSKGSDYSAVIGRLYAGGSPIGAEFQVNTTLVQSYYADVGMDAAGNFVVVWGSYDIGLGGTTGIIAQRFDSTGGRRGSEVRVNASADDYVTRPRIGVEPSGSYVVVWEGDGDGSSLGIFGQRFESTGAKAGTEFQVNAFTLGDQGEPAVVVVEGGEFGVAWTSEPDGLTAPQDGDDCGVFVQAFDPAGNRDGAEFQANAYTLGCQSAPVPLPFVDGEGFVVLWESDGQDGDESGVFAQPFTSDDERDGEELQINTFTLGSQEHIGITADGGGGIVVVWESEEPFGSPAPGHDGSGDAVFAQRFINGDPDGPEFQVNAFTIDDQNGPAVGPTSDGFVVAWRSAGQDGDEGGIFGRLFHVVP